MWFFRYGLCVGFLLAVAAGPPPSHAQSPRTESVRTPVRSELQRQVARRDSLLEFQTRRTARGRVDVRDGVLRADYRIEAQATTATDPVEAARAYLRGNVDAYGFRADLSDLELVEMRETSFSHHVLFQQTYAGVPVLRRQVKVSLNRHLEPTMAISGYDSSFLDAAGLDPVPNISPDAARGLAAGAFERGGDAGEPELFVFPGSPLRLVWRVVALPVGQHGEWEVLIDAHTGEFVSLRDQATHANLRGQRHEPEEANDLVSTPGVSSRGDLVSSATVVARADGSGLVFDPDPVTRAGVSYGGAFIDAGDADSDALNDQRTEVVLRDISQGTDGLYRLEGPFIQIVGAGLGQSYSPPALSDPNGFRYTRAEPEFEAVMAYYHIDASQRYVESLNAGTPAPRIVRVNPRGYSTDNSEYMPSQHAIIFGTGGIDDAEDGSVVRHEHAHAILNNTTAGILSTLEGAAFHEGWADYWATSLLKQQIDAGEVPPRDWSHVFPWDGNTSSWCGRFLNHPGRYPDQTEVSPPSGCGAYPRIYQEGILWATTLMEIHTELGGEVTDRLNLASHSYLIPPVTFADAAEALIQADVDLYGGMHTGTLILRLSERGYVDASTYGPVIAHEPLPNTESLGGTVPIEVMATGANAEVDSVIVFFGTTTIPTQRLELIPVGTGRFVGDLPLPSEPDTLRYYIEAVDVLMRRSFLPNDGPVAAFEVIVGPDSQPPAISHTPIQRSSLAAWPATVSATVEDAFGVDSVWVTYQISDSLGGAVADGAFGLTRMDGIYRGSFPVDVNIVSSGDRVSYAIHARDGSVAGNVRRSPSDGNHQFRIVSEGVLREYDFELPDAGIVASGVWEVGPPTYGVQIAHSGTNVWGTHLSGPYPAAPQHSSLELPGLNLESLGTSYLVFWHWHDFEHNGKAVPDSMKAIPLWDGGNVKASTDGGATWHLLVPVSGYNGTIEPNLDNPLGGQRGFGGYSFGWRRVGAGCGINPQPRLSVRPKRPSDPSSLPRSAPC